VKLADQFIDLGRHAEEPVKIIVVRLLLTLGSRFFDAFSKFVGILSQAQGQKQFAFIANAGSINAYANPKRAILVAEGLEFRLIKDLLESSA
jgi:hypothetical protein